MAMELIETIEVGSGGAASIEFTSIPQDGVDLLLVLSIRSDNAGSDYPVYVVINNDTTSTYQNLWLRGNGSSVDSLSNPVTAGVYAGNTPAASSTSNTFGNFEIYLSNYTSSANKSVSVASVGENNSTAAKQIILASNYPTSSAITSLKADPLLSNAVQYSTASLYKIY